MKPPHPLPTKTQTVSFIYSFYGSGPVNFPSKHLNKVVKYLMKNVGGVNFSKISTNSKLKIGLVVPHVNSKFVIMSKKLVGGLEGYTNKILYVFFKSHLYKYQIWRLKNYYPIIWPSNVN